MAGRWRRRALTLCALTAAAWLLASLLFSQHSDQPPPGRAGGALSITGRADGAFPAHMTAAELAACVRQRRVARGRPLRLVFIGHSRVRQVYETLRDRLQLPLLTREEAARDQRQPFVDQELEPPWWHYADANSTCAGVWPKLPHPADAPANAWCSQVAASSEVDLEYRWRNDLHLFQDALSRVEAACAAARCPDLLVLNQGLHFLVRQHFSWLAVMYQHLLELAAPRVERLAARGVHVIWLLEQPGNPRAGRGSYNDDTMVMNSLVTARFAGRRVHVWTAALSAVAGFWARSCFALMPRVDKDEYHVCAFENFHVDNRTLATLADQLMRFVCEDESE